MNEPLQELGEQPIAIFRTESVTPRSTRDALMDSSAFGSVVSLMTITSFIIHNFGWQAARGGFRSIKWVADAKYPGLAAFPIPDTFMNAQHQLSPRGAYPPEDTSATKLRTGVGIQISVLRSGR